MSNQWREDQNRCQREIERHQNADKSYLDEGVALLDLARNAQRLFSTQEPREKRRLLNFVLSNCTWEGGEVVATFRQPFDMLAETATAAGLVGAGDESKSSKNEIWLGRKDSNLDMAIPKSDALACQRELQNPVSLELISLSKHSNFENRTESAESRAPERNEPFGEE